MSNSESNSDNSTSVPELGEGALDNSQEPKTNKNSKNRLPIYPAAIVLFLVLLIVIGALPRYLSGNWPWTQMPQITSLNRMRQLRQIGLEFSGWQTVERKQVRIGGHRWLYQKITRDDREKPITLLLLPQQEQKGKPEVEWMDIEGSFRWKTDSIRQLKFTVEGEGDVSEVEVVARFFRAWNDYETFAVVQWYAFPNGGDFSPSNWFWADLFAQFHRRRIPWIAVSLNIPIEPLGDVEAASQEAQSLGKIVQKILINEVFEDSPSARE